MIEAHSVGAVQDTDYRGVRTLKQCLGYDIKQSNDKTPVMLELWGMWSTHSLLLLPGLLWLGVLVHGKALSMCQMLGI